MNKFSYLGLSALIAFSSAAAQPLDDNEAQLEDNEAQLEELSATASQMAREALHERQTQPIPKNFAEKFQIFVKIDRTILYGNYVSMMSGEFKMNAALGDHYVISNGLRSCKNLASQNLTIPERMDMLTDCLGNMQTFFDFKILNLNLPAITELRRRLYEVKCKLMPERQCAKISPLALNFDE